MAPVHQRSGAGNAALHIVRPVADEPRQRPRVLRIGLVESGRIVDEKLIERGRDVSIGASEKNDFVIDDDRLRARHALFERRRDGGYTLCFTDDMGGRVSFPGGFSELSVLRQSGKVRRSGRTFRFDLDDDARGKVEIGVSTFLFQMVTAPPARPKPKLPAAVRGGWLGRIDWFFSSLVIASFLAQFGIVIWLVQRDWPVTPAFTVTSEYDRLLFDTRPSQFDIERWQKRAPAPEDATPLVAPIPVDDPSPGPRSPGKARVPRSSRSAPAADAERRAALERAARDRVQKALGESARELLGRINLIGSKNPQGRGAIDDVLSGGGVEVDQDRVLAQITGLEVASRDGGGVLRRPTAGDRDGDVADVGTLRPRGPSVDVESEGMGSETAVTSRIKRGDPISSPSSQGTLDETAVRRVVGGALGGIKACYERSLRRNRSLRGRVAISFTVGSGGRVTRASAVQNTLGAPEVGQCLETRFRALRFPPPDGGPVTFHYPFLFEPSH